MDNFVRRIITPPRKKIARFVSAGDVTADIGCGPGYFTLPMAELAGPTGKVYAADADPKSINALKEKTDTHGLQNIEAEAASAARMKFIPDHCVDFAFANGVLCCMVDHDGAVSEIKRILKPNGLCYLSVAKLFRKDDVRAVPKKEWEEILKGFEVQASHEGILNRWATVRIKAN
jgi:ubiquinone/menaquinone biosynthesis C-methylase UbiE